MTSRTSCPPQSRQSGSPRRSNDDPRTITAFRRLRVFGNNSGGEGTGGGVGTTQNTTLAVTADSYVRGGSGAGVNFGAAQSLLVKKNLLPNDFSGNNITYLKFNLANVPGMITNAKLRLYGAVSDGFIAMDVAAHAVADISWNEANLTWNIRPPVGAHLTSASVNPANPLLGTNPAFYEWDLTNYLRTEKAAGRNVVSIALQSPTAYSYTDTATFNSRESASNQPQVVVTSFISSATPTPTPTPAPTPNAGGTLYLATMLPEGSALSSASGSSTLLLSADESFAVINFAYSNLTTPNTATHLHGPADPGMSGGRFFSASLTATTRTARNSARTRVCYAN